MVNGQGHTTVRSTGRQSFAAGVRLRADFEIPLLVFLLSAFLGMAVSYDGQAALPRLGWIIAGLILAVLVAYAPDSPHIQVPRPNQLRPLTLVFGVLPTAIAAHLFGSYDWSGLPDPRSVETVTQYATWFWTKVEAGPPYSVAGGVIAAFIPLQLRSLSGLWSSGMGAKVSTVIAVGFAVVGLGLSKAHAAWLVLPTVLVIWWLSAHASRSVLLWGGFKRDHSVRSLLLIAVAVALGIYLAYLGFGAAFEFLVDRRPDRLGVWRNSLDLAGDYPLTGIGLGAFAMAYSSYTLLVHVPHTFHAHNLFLDLHLQQGLLGLLTFVCWVGLAVRPGISRSTWVPAARAALGVIIWHGLVDDPFFGYGGEAAALAFLPLGLLARNSAVGVHQFGKPVRSNGRRLGALAAAGGVAIALLIGFAPDARALVFANAGALAQTRAELSVFRWPAYAIQDELRLKQVVDVDTPAAYYRAALALDATHVTANRRLGQIELSLGNYDAALTYLQAAWKAAPQQRATLQLLAEALAVTGNVDEAATLLRLTDDHAGQWVLRQWWYAHYLRDEKRAANLTKAIEAARR